MVNGKTDKRDQVVKWKIATMAEPVGASKMVKSVILEGQKSIQMENGGTVKSDKMAKSVKIVKRLSRKGGQNGEMGKPTRPRIDSGGKMVKLTSELKW